MEREIAAKGVIYRLEGCEPRGSSLDVLVRLRELRDRAEMELVGEWVGICREHHGGWCERQGGHEVIERGFRLVDCMADPPVVGGNLGGRRMWR